MQQIATSITSLLEACSKAEQSSGCDLRLLSARHDLMQYLHEQYGIEEAIFERSTTTDAQLQELAAALPVDVAGADPELLNRMLALILTLNGGQSSPAVGVSLEEVAARLLEIHTVTSSDVGVQLTNSQFDEDIRIDQVHTGNAYVLNSAQLTPALLAAAGASGSLPTGTQSTGSSVPVAVTLTNVKAGGGIHIGSITQAITQFFVGKSADTGKSARSRKNMLSLVEDMWIKGALLPSLRAGSSIQLQFAASPESVQNRPFDELVQMPAAPVLTVVPNEDILDILHKSRQRLLILGEPGAGKTTLLLLVAQAMIVAARQDAQAPIPVILNLASWTRQHPNLDSWVLTELKEKYEAPTAIAEPWLAQDDFMLLLDGLDEVDHTERVGCVSAINRFLGEHQMPMVVCSRKTEYLELAARLRLAMAVEIMPLGPDQINAYIHTAQLDQSGLPALIESNEQLRDLASAPLMLHMMMVGAERLPALTLSPGTPDSDWQPKLFGTYVDAMFHRRSKRTPYTPQQTVTWLSWLARQMMTQGQPVFLMERMQPALLPNRRQQLLYHIAIRVFCVLLFMATNSLAVSLLVLATTGDPSRALVVFGLGLLLGGAVALPMLVASIVSLWLSELWAVILTIGFFAGVWAVFGRNSATEITMGALVFGLLGSLAGVLFSGKRPIRPVDVIAWSWPKLRTQRVLGLVGAIALVLVITAVIAADNLFLVLILGVCCLLPVLLLGMTVDDEIKPTRVPNQGMHASLRTAALVASVTALMSGLIAYAWMMKMEQDTLVGITLGVVMGVLVGLVTGLAGGGAAVTQHYLLRAILAASNTLPWEIRRFLDYGTERVFLRRVGGGYIFYHRLLMEYLATAKEMPNDDRTETAHG